VTKPIAEEDVGQQEILLIVSEKYKMLQILRKQFEIFSESNFMLFDIYPTNVKTMPTQNLHTNIYSSSIHHY
jgi:hypothetical protein